MLTPVPFAVRGSTELQQNAELALYLLRFLETRRDPHERIWRGERALRTLQYACQVLEALYELNIRGLTHHLAEPAANWIMALPLDVPPEDLRPFRLFPSRFKVLAQVGKFDPARLMSDFDGLAEHFDPATGWMHDAPIDLHPTLVTLIWLDTFHRLDGLNLLSAEHRARCDQALTALQTTFESWLAQTAAEQQSGQHAAEGPGLRPGALANAADASYAFDLLCRFGRLPADSQPAEAARQVLLHTLRAGQPTALRR